MKHIIIYITLLLFILGLSILAGCGVEAMDNSVITADKLAKLNNILVNPTNDNSDTIIEYIKGLRLNNPFFESIICFIINTLL